MQDTDMRLGSSASISYLYPSSTLLPRTVNDRTSQTPFQPLVFQFENEGFRETGWHS